MDYGFKANGQIFTPNQTSVNPDDNHARNKAIEKTELELWANAPDRFTAYYHFDGGHAEITRELSAFRRYGRSSWIAGAEIRTWLGTKIGVITSAHIYRHNFGGRLIVIRAIGSNGAEYYGRASYDRGNYIHLRKAKS
jgi:hypothetical protein